MIRKTLTILSLIGLLLSVGLWGVSYWNLVHLNSKRTMMIAKGGYEFRKLYFRKLYRTYSPYIAMRKKPDGSIEPPPFNRWHSNGFGAWQTRWLPEISRSPLYIYIPLWIPSIVFGLTFLSCRPLHFHRRRKRRKLGLCLQCGYDLHGLTEPRCPECNTPFDEKLLNKNA